MAENQYAMTVAVKGGKQNESVPTPKRIVSDALTAMRGQHGGSVPAASDYETPDYADIDGGITPDYANKARKLDNKGVFDGLALRDELDGVFGENHSGSAPVTTVFNTAEYSVKSAVNKMESRGDIGAAIDKAADEMTPDIDLTDAQKTQIRDKATKIVAYKVAEFAKGWVAEKIITASDAFSKASASNDMAEQDAYAVANAEYTQIKCVTLGYKPNPTIDVSGGAGNHVTTKNGVPVVYYQWDCRGNIVVGRNHKVVNGIAAENAGVPKTTIARTHSAYEIDGETYRRLWW